MSTTCSSNLDSPLVPLLTIFNTSNTLGAARSLSDIGLNVKLNHYIQVKLVQIHDTHGNKRWLDLY